ncbi:Na+/H+ antiporter subunit E [Acidobacteriota bacterium]
MRKAFIRGTVWQFFVLFGLWLILSGKYDLFHISTGFFSALIVTLIHLRINRYLYFQKLIAKDNSLRYIRFLFFVPWLIWEILLASLQVAYVVLHPRIPINPSMVRFKTKLPNIAARVILGNSITLTPGTLTVNIDDDEFLVHALTDASQSGIVDGSLPKQVAKLYQRRPSTVIDDIKIERTARRR